MAIVHARGGCHPNAELLHHAYRCQASRLFDRSLFFLLFIFIVFFLIIVIG